MTNYTQSAAAAGRETLDRASDAASQMGHDVADAAQSAGQKASAAVGQAGEMAQEQLESMAAYVRRNPLQATAIAAAIGFGFALLARR